MLTEKLKAANDRFAELRKQFRDEGKTLLTESFKELFDLCSGLQAICWTQYAPHFNDGEACTFNVNEVHFINDADEAYDWPSSEFQVDFEKISPEADKGADAIAEFIGDNEDLMQDMFGPDSMIVVTRDGVAVSDYGENHD